MSIRQRTLETLELIAGQLLKPPDPLPLSRQTGERTLQLAESIARRLGLLAPLPSDMATVTYTIGTGGRDYSTISSHAADADNSGLYSAGDDIVGELYNDSVFDEMVAVDGGGTVGVNSITYRPAAGQEHDGTAGSGVRIIDSSASSPYQAFTLNVDGIDKTIEKLEISRTSSISLALIGPGSLSATTTLTVKHCILHGLTATTSGGPAAVNFPNVGSAVWSVCRNLVYAITHNTANASDVYGIKFLGVGAGTCLAGNTIHAITKAAGTGDAWGISVSDDADLDIINNISTDPTNTGSGSTGAFTPATFTNANASNNLSSDATAPGTGSLVNKSAANQFVSTTPGSEDLHLKSGADAIDAGANLGTTPAGIQYDIDGTDVTGGTWDIGADEFESAPTGSIGSSTGSSTVAAVAAAIAISVASSTGTATTNGTAAAIASATASATGTATASATAAAVTPTDGTASGSSTATAAAASVAAATGTANGSATSSAAGVTVKPSAGSATGSSTTAGVAPVGSGSTGTSSGSSTASGAAASIASATGTASGSSTAAGISNGDASAGTSAGSSTATAAGVAVITSTGTAAGSAATSGSAASTAAATGTTNGSATAGGIATAINRSTATSSGTSTAIGYTTTFIGVPAVYRRRLSAVFHLAI